MAENKTRQGWHRSLPVTAAAGFPTAMCTSVLGRSVLGRPTPVVSCESRRTPRGVSRRLLREDGTVIANGLRCGHEYCAVGAGLAGADMAVRPSAHSYLGQPAAARPGDRLSAPAA